MRAPRWTAAFAPSGTPREIVEVLHKSFVEASHTPELQAAFDKGGMTAPQQSSVEDAHNWLREEMASWRRDIPEANVTVD